MAVVSPTLRDPGTSGIHRGFRRAVAMAGVAAAAAIIGLSVAGHWQAGVFVALGLAAGAWNASKVTQSAPKVLDGGALNKRSMSGSSMARLGYLTVLAAVCALAFKPYGWTIVLGLAAFQLLLIVNTVGSLLREVRRG